MVVVEEVEVVEVVEEVEVEFCEGGRGEGTASTLRPVQHHLDHEGGGGTNNYHH